MKEVNVDLETHLANFLEKHVPKKEQIYVAFSGGPDSTTLLYALVNVVQDRELHVVHIDHGWRKESGEQAQRLEEHVALLGLPFQTFRLARAPEGENVEDWCRRERMKFFAALGAKRVLLAHHADDQIEVVLKRFLEGSSIKNFRGMRAVEERDGLTLLRPFLSFRKKELLAWIETRKISYINDPSNRDPKYLRARFREELLPALRKSFGKEFEESLLRISEEAHLLEEWVNGSLSEVFFFGEGKGIAYASAKKKNISPFLVHHLIDVLRKKCRLSAPSRKQVLEASSHFAAEPCGGRSFPVGAGVIVVEHEWMGVFAEKPFPIPTRVCDQKEGHVSVGRWEVSWKEGVFEEAPKISWQELLQGKPFQAMIPKKDFTISRSSEKLLSAVKRQTFSPTSLRSFVPAILQEGYLVADPLSGYSVSLSKGEACYKIDIHILNEELA